MPAKKSAKKHPTPVKGSATKRESTFTADEQSAMREHAQEVKAARRRGNNDRAGDEAAVREKLASMSPSDRAMGERLHEIITRTAPDLAPKLWYGMPAYAKDGNVVCFFQGALKFKTRYSTLGFSDNATLDEGELWPTSYAVSKLTPEVEARIAALVKKAMR